MPTGTFSLEEAYGVSSVPSTKKVQLEQDPSVETINPDDNSVVRSNRSGSLPADDGIRNLIMAAATKYNVPPEYAFALAEQESGYNPDARNSEYGAAGLYQFIPETAKALGIDPTDPAQAADAAMKDFAEQMSTRGVDWAIKHHFAGPNESLHGRKTAQYLADVTRRAEDIRNQLGIKPKAKPEDKKPSGSFSLEEAYGTPVQQESTQSPPVDTGGVFDPAINAAKSSWDFVKDRFLTDLGIIKEGEPGYHPRVAEIPSKDEELQWRQRLAANPAEAKNLPKYLQHLLPQADVHGFINSLENPIKLITSDSLPANFISFYANLPQIERKKIDQARQIMMQEDVANHPDKYPAVSVEAAKKAIAARKAKQDPTVRQLWSDMFQAAKDDPGRFGGALVNSLIADPELLFTPAGLGTRIIGRTTELATGVANTGGRAAALADKIIDAGSVAGALNTAISAQDQLARGNDLNYNELKSAAGMGAVIGGPLGAIFSRGARAKLLDLDAERLKGTLEDTLRDRAKYDIEAEAAIQQDWRPGLDTPTQQRINDMLGITGRTDREKLLEQRRKDVRAAFKNESDYADYLRFKAEERIDRAATIKAEAEQRAAAEAAQRQAAADAAEVRIPSPDAPQGVSPGEVFRALRTPGHLRTAEDMVAIRAVRGQRGEVDPQLLARMGAVGLGAAAAYAISPEEQKLKNSFFGGLAGLLIPGGGSVLRRMRQSGAISPEGDIMSALIRDGKLVEAKDLDTIRAEDKALVDRAKAGDQEAMKKLYENNFSKLERSAGKFLREAGPKLGIEPADIVQDAFAKAFKNLDSFRGNSQFYTWMHQIVRNEGLQAVRSAAGKPDQTSIYNPSLGTGGDKTEGLTGQVGLGGEKFPDAITSTAESAMADLDTPENVAIRNQVNQQIINTLNKLNPKIREAVIKSQIELMTDAEIAKELNEPLGTIKDRINRGKIAIEEALAKGWNAKPGKDTLTIRVPKSQRGAVDEKLLKLGAIATLGAGAGAYLNQQNSLAGAGIGAVTALGIFGLKGKSGKSAAEQIVHGADYTTGLLSTRVMGKSKELWMRMLNHERVVLRDTHRYLKAVDPFLVKLNTLPKEINGLVSRAILTGDHVVTDRLLKEIGDNDLINGWKDVRSTLDKLGDQLVHLKRFKNKELDYFPRIVKDVEGLQKALGREKGGIIESALRDADSKAVRERGTGLSELERSLIINKILSEDAKKGGQPGYAKNRVVEEITPELQQYYATPTESLHSYIRSAVEDIERARFFGKDLEVVTKEGKEYTNSDKSIGKLVDRLIQEGKLEPKDQAELSDMLKSRFINGERAPSELIQLAKNLSTAGLLGNPISAATQLGDVVMQFYAQDIRATLQALGRQLTGRKHLNMKDFGLSDHVAEEFVSTSRSTKFLNTAFKLGLFKAVDEMGKNTGLNAAVIRQYRLAKTERGIAELGRRYAEALGPVEFKQWIKDLQSGEKSDLVHQMAFAELSRTQPITRIELPQAYLDNPNGRLIYQFKTFMLKQADLVRRDAYNEIKVGNVSRGMRNLATIGVTLGVSGMSTQLIKDFLLNRDTDLKASDVLTNAMKTFGLTQYYLDQALGVSKEEAKARRAAGEENVRAQKAAPVTATAKVLAPPFKIFDDIASGDPKAWRYVPVIGPILYEYVMKEDSKKGSGK